jgi:8-oxo-dGTP pyrophosphatase MutT (NUDIX family)
MNNKLINQLKVVLNRELPGENAHQKMYPSNRLEENFVLKTSQEFRDSAVVILIVEDEDCLHCVLTQRQNYVGKHSGEISFPGGKKETEESILQTAIRECEEEIGVKLDFGNLIGELTEVYIPVSGFKVQPFIFYLQEKPIYIQNQREVAEIIHFPLNQLLDDSIVATTCIQLTENSQLNDVPFFSIQNKIIWGATAIILSELKELLKLVETKRGET